MKHPIYIISAIDEKFGIGKNNTLPWRIPEDLKHFHDITTKTQNPDLQNMVIMGKSTWKSIPKKFRPLPNRKNVVLSRGSYEADDAETASSFEEAYAFANDSIESIFIIGGGSIYKQSISRPEISGIYLTKISGDFECDTFFPKIPDQFSEIRSFGGGENDDMSYEFLLYTRS